MEHGCESKKINAEYTGTKLKGIKKLNKWRSIPCL